MKILLTGATGFVGSRLKPTLESAGHVVRVVSRRAGAEFDWSDASLARGVRETDAIVHLAGESVFEGRWNPARKELLRSSRIDTTKKLAALAAARKPACFVSASAIGWYGTSETGVFDESSPRGSDFLADLSGDWEDAVEAASEAGVRSCRVRIGVVLDPAGGALAKMLPIFRLGLGGPLASGRQWVSWVHLDDLCRLFQFLIENDRARGVFDGTAPHPVTMKEFASTLGRVLHRPSFLPVPEFMLRLTVGEVAGVLATGQRVLPRRAQEAGFRFEHPELEGALRALLVHREGSRS